MGGGLSGKKNFRENAFTEIVVEYLSEIGMVENGEVCYCETRVGRGIGKVSGFGFNDDEDTLEVFTSVFLDSGVQGALPSDDIRKGAETCRKVCAGMFQWNPPEYGGRIRCACYGVQDA